MKKFLTMLFVGLFAMTPHIGIAGVADFFEATDILNVTDDLPKAEYARDFQGQGYELSSGEYQSFNGWYERRGPSIYVEGITILRPNFALEWGIGTGEDGEKYQIYPSLKLGFRYLHQVSENSDFVLSAHRVFGGGFGERSCTANYGALGEAEEVNCRLAASLLAPKDTLKYLIRDFDETWGVSFRYEWRF